MTTAPALTDLTVLTIETPSLGDRSYVVHDGRVAAVIDPQRDVDRVTALLDEHRLTLTHVLETHVHNDYLTGGLALARATGATYVVNADDPVKFERLPVRDGDVVSVGGRIRLEAIATPGHTFTHLSWALRDGERPVAVFSGGSLLYGATGRPDLLGAEHTHELAHHQHASVHRLADSLPDSAAVYPTHGFGSFCSATQAAADSSTIGEERRTNPVMQQDVDSWVADLLDALGEWPAYYVHMAPANLRGPAAPDLSPPAPADREELRRRLTAGEWVIDLRDRIAFAAGHAPGTVNIGIDGAFSTYVGWLVDHDAPITLLGSSAEQVSEAQRELVRIGIDRPAAAASGAPTEWTDLPLGSFPRAGFGELAEVRHHRPVVVLDVRRVDEAAEVRIEGSVRVPLHELTDRLSDVPAGEVWVHCASGYRASIAASILAAAGRQVVAVDDELDTARDAGVGLVSA
jgi:hydroxyacylglutathione hydrolase